MIMKKARVVVTVKKDVLDPAGVAVKNALLRQGIANLAEVRIGKVIDIVFRESASLEDRALIENCAQAILSNPIMEDVSIELLDEKCHDK
jgi:phosphoribosylformylglycinamidine synthase